MVRSFVLVATSLAIALPHAAISAPADLPSSRDAIAVEINGATLSLGDIESKRPAAMFQARSNFYELTRKTLEEYVDDFLLNQQAVKEGVTVEQLLATHVNGVIAKDPSEETLQVYYETVDTTEPYASVRGKIIDAIRQRRITKAKTAYMAQLRSQAKIVYRLAPPRAPIAPEDTPARGPADARIVLTEYADYECPYCQQVQPTIDKLETEFRGKLAFRYKDFPLPMHPNAQKAAEATRCAQAQGKYWDFHDQLTHGKPLDIAALKGYARQLKLDDKKFDSCLDQGEKADAVKAHSAEAQALGLQGTPSFFINGRYVSGNLSYERLRGVILEEIAGGDLPSGGASREGVSRQ